MRTPLALRLSPATRSALARRAVAEGFDPGASDFAEYVGDLVAAALPEALAEAADQLVGAAARERLAPHLSSEMAEPGPKPGSASESLTTSPTAIVAASASELESCGARPPAE